MMNRLACILTGHLWLPVPCHPGWRKRCERCGAVAI